MLSRPAREKPLKHASGFNTTLYYNRTVAVAIAHTYYVAGAIQIANDSYGEKCVSVFWYLPCYIMLKCTQALYTYAYEYKFLYLHNALTQSILYEWIWYTYYYLLWYRKNMSSVRWYMRNVKKNNNFNKQNVI